MYRTKKDVDKHVEHLISKLSLKDFQTRAYSVARLYFEVGDYENAKKYAEQYLSHKDNNAAAHKLLGQTLQKLGQREKAIEQFKISLDIDPTQTSTILDICELLADDEVSIDPGRAKYWCEKAEATFPRHPISFRLRERLVSITNPDPEALVKLLTAELEVRPKDATLHARLLKHFLCTNQIKEAFNHSCNVEFSSNTFRNNPAWYDTLAEILKYKQHSSKDWLYQLLLLTVKERLCVLSLIESPTRLSKSLIESTELLHSYDQAIDQVTKVGTPTGCGEFHASLLQHHRGQFVFLAATLLLKKAKKDHINWKDASQLAAPLMLISWQSVPLDIKVNWLKHAPEKQQKAVHRWYIEGSYRCSQSGHYLLANSQNLNQSFLDRISECCSGSHWKDKLFENIFTSADHLSKRNLSSFLTDAYGKPILRLPRRIEVEAYDGDAQKEYPNSLHHFVWTILNYKNFAHFKFTLFGMLSPTSTSCGPETLNKLDIHAFLYCAALSAHQRKTQKNAYVSTDKTIILPANITDLLCTIPQMKWWDCAYKFTQNELGPELTDIRATISRGIEVVRCIDNHGLDPELLCSLGKIFSEMAKLSTVVDEKSNLEGRAVLYYVSAIPVLEKLKNKMSVKLPEKPLFDFTHRDLGLQELNSLIGESKLYVAINYYNNGEYEKVIQLLSNLKSSQAYYYLGQTYKKIALQENNSIESRSKYTALLSKAKNFAYKALDEMKDTDMNINKNHQFYSDVQQLIEEIECNPSNNDFDGKYSSDESNSMGSETIPLRNNHHVVRNLYPTSTPNSNITHYRTANDSDMLQSPGSRAIPSDQIFKYFNTLQSTLQNNTDQLKLLKLSVDEFKDQVDQCRNECKDIVELKKQLSDLKKEVNKMKSASSEQAIPINDSDLYNLEEDLRPNESASNFTAQLPFQPQVMPQFNQRLLPPFSLPPNPYQIYSQNLYNLYNQYSQFAQTPTVPGAPGAPLFDPTRATMNYPGVYPSPDQMFVDIAHFVPPTVSSAHTIPTVPPVPTVPSGPTLSLTTTATIVPPLTTTVTQSKYVETKEIQRSLPANVVITSSDPLPTCTTTPAPILSVTIPPKHIKGSPHNYQIQMPSMYETNAVPPIFGFPTSGNKPVTSASTLINWGQSPMFKATQPSKTGTESFFFSPKVNDSIDDSKCVVNGSFTEVSPNNSQNKSRTLSERSNTSVENYDPCPDFKPIIPLPDEVKVTTGEEDEIVVFCARAKLFRFDDKQWKERGIGEMKLLKHNTTGKVRVLMRREQVHKICANHIIVPEMEIRPMKNETKAYFWVANDFADESVVLEKFCIRFKTTDIAMQFFATFEKARSKSSGPKPTNISKPNIENEVNIPKITQDKPSTTPIKGANISVFSQSGKKEFGGFTFSSTPTLKPLEETNTDAKLSEPAITKSNIFSNFNFKTTSAPLNDVFSTAPTSNANISSSTLKQDTPTKLNSSDVVEEYEPNVEFKPVVPLPALIDHKTGEEEENVMFEHRAKLLRFDAVSKEWKERGLGNIKILIHKENNQKIRLLMRREQIMKVCCNHALTKEMSFQKMANMDKAVTWCAQDFSEGELTVETFCLRFKTASACDNFIGVIKSAQSKIKDEAKNKKEVQNAAKQNHQSGSASWGDKFKPKAGSWECNGCFVRNNVNDDYCKACDSPKDPSMPKNEMKIVTDNAPKFNFGIPALTTIVPKIEAVPKVTSISGFGDKFKPKEGSWECNGCFVKNNDDDDYCKACNSPKDPSIPKNENKFVADNAPKFSFGIPAQNTIVPKIEAVPKVTTISGFGDKFKPKQGSWECNGCLVRNNADIDHCGACDSPRDPSMPKKEIKLVPDNAPKFSFGIPLQSADVSKVEANPTGLDINATRDMKSILNNTSLVTTFSFGMSPSVPQQKSENSSIFDGSGAHMFSFGGLSATAGISQKPPNVVCFGDQKPSIFASKSNSTHNETTTPAKPALLPTPQKDSTFGNKDGGTFDFIFKPKTTKGKSPMKSPKNEKGEDSDGDEYASEDEGHHIHFSPVVPLPDKVKVVTGEENEIELYGHRAKLFRFTLNEWKERGIGIVKILKHKDTGKLRIVMRREQVLKICLNHALSPEIIYTPKDDKTWLFAANDYSEGELSLQQFCLRFKTKEIATEFKDAVETAKEGKVTVNKDMSLNKQDDNSEDIIFVSETVATEAEKEKAQQLMLPENFYTYKNKAPCRGCRGCQDDEDAIKISQLVAQSQISTPIKTTPLSFQSPMNSFYGTPASLEKSVNASIFQTPMGSMGSDRNSSGTSTNEDVKSSVKNVFGVSDNSLIFASLTKPTTSISGNAEPQTATAPKTAILAPPKLSTLNKSGGETRNVETKSVFGSSMTSPVYGNDKPLFGDANVGISINKSIFNFKSEDTDNSQTPDVKSVFNSEDKPVNLFSGANQGSLFGPAALNNHPQSSTSLFGTGQTAFGFNTPQSQVFESEKPSLDLAKSVFGFASKTPSSTGENKPDVTTITNFTSRTTDVAESNIDVTKKDPIFKVDNTLSFAALSSNEQSFNVSKNTNFQWEGAGQQLFGGGQKCNKSKNDSGTADDSVTGAEEEYDPHYEPIVPLPDKIVVTTGEEDEEKLFGERAKLYRYEDKTKEWKERGVGEMKVLYHPERKTYRLLLRREQVHKAVLNMLMFMDLELLPMKNSDRAWTWAGHNFAENPAGEQETLAVRFKSVDLAANFHKKVVECVQKLQALNAQAVKEEKESPAPVAIAPLRLPKHMDDSARVDSSLQTQTYQVQSYKGLSNPNMEVFKQVQFEQQQPVVREEDDEEYDYDHNEDYEGYYNDEDDESAAYYACDGEAIIHQGTIESVCDNAHVQVLLDQDIYSPKILVTDKDTGEILADMVIHTETEFQMDGNSCSWSGEDYTSNHPVDKSVTINFPDSDTVMQFYDSCETSKSATYSSADQE